MNEQIKKRCVEFGYFILKNNQTIRGTAKHFKVSKSTVHNDLSVRLKYVNTPLFSKVKKHLAWNFEEKHIRGGNSTKIKFKKK